MQRGSHLDTLGQDLQIVDLCRSGAGHCPHPFQPIPRHHLPQPRAGGFQALGQMLLYSFPSTASCILPQGFWQGEEGGTWGEWDQGTGTVGKGGRDGVPALPPRCHPPLPGPWSPTGRVSSPSVPAPAAQGHIVHTPGPCLGKSPCALD